MTLRQQILARSTGAYLNLLGYANPAQATAFAYRLFSSPRSGRFPNSTLPTLLKAQRHAVLKYDGHEFQTYKWDGRGKTVLLVHGWESNAARWEQLLPYLLESGYSIVAFDAPAHGLSTGTELNLPFYAQTITRCLEEFNPDYLIGHSIGAAASLMSQHDNSHQSLEKMVLLGAPADMSVILENFVKILGLNDRNRKRLEEYFVHRFNGGIETFTATRFCKAVTVPTLVAHDELDDVVAYTEGLKIADAWPNATFITTRGLGHSMHDDVLYRKVVSFLG